MASSKNRTLTDIVSQPLLGFILLTISILSLLGLVSFAPGDSSSNFLGLIGHGIGWFLRFSFGLASYVLLSGLFILSIKWISKEEIEDLPFKCLLFAALVFSASFLLNLLAETCPTIAALAGSSVVKETTGLRSFRYNLGGVPSYYLLHDLPLLNLQHLLSNTGTFLVFTAIAIAVSLELTHWKPAHYLINRLKEWYENRQKRATIPVFAKPSEGMAKKAPAKEPFCGSDPLKRPTLSALPALTAKLKSITAPAEKESAKIISKPEKKELEFVAAPRPKAALPAKAVLPPKGGPYALPPLSLLTDVKKYDTSLLYKELRSV